MGLDRSVLGARSKTDAGGAVMTHYPGPIPFTGVSELVLEVINLDEAERFYTDVLGLPVVERWTKKHPSGGEAVWLMAGTHTRIGLWKPMVGLGNAQGGVHVHYALYVAQENFESTVQRIRDKGYKVLVWDHARYGHGRKHTMYVTDPAGHVVEIWPWDVAEHLTELAAGESPGSL
jgi:catechol 2,3-dioxygenase-like lactoylglutathione lyase family enzyme